MKKIRVFNSGMPLAVTLPGRGKVQMPDGEFKVGEGGIPEDLAESLVKYAGNKVQWADEKDEPKKKENKEEEVKEEEVKEEEAEKEEKPKPAKRGRKKQGA